MKCHQIAVYSGYKKSLAFENIILNTISITSSQMKIYSVSELKTRQNLCHATVTQTVHEMVGAFEIQHWEK